MNTKVIQGTMQCKGWTKKERNTKGKRKKQRGREGEKATETKRAADQKTKIEGVGQWGEGGGWVRQEVRKKFQAPDASLEIQDL